MRVYAPSTTDFEGWQFALSSEAVDGSWMQPQKARDFDYRENLSALRHRVVLWGRLSRDCLEETTRGRALQWQTLTENADADRAA